jgi:uncharacterized protein
MPETKSPEVRCLNLAVAELRVERRADGKPVIVGYTAVFNTWSEDLGGFIERVIPGAFARTLREGADVRALVNHDPSLILGRNKAGTLRLREDAKGLRHEIDLPGSSLAGHYAEAVERGDISGMSFRFYVGKEAWNFSADPVQRDLIDVDIDDVSLATYPAYTDTSAAVRSLEQHRRSQPRPGAWRDRAARAVRLRLAEAER